MLHEIGEKDYCREYIDGAKPRVGDVLLSFRDGNVLFDGASLARIQTEDLAHPLQYLFSISGVGFFLSRTPLAETGARHYERVQALRRLFPQWLAFAGMTGYHLAVWYANNRYCGGCATPLEHKHDERALICPHCGRVYYPNIAVAVIVGILDGERLLLSRYAGTQPYHYDSYALIAGYVEIGETLEEAVRREVMEEVGLNVKNIRYYASQPWGFSQTLLAGFFAELDGPDGVRLERAELSEAVWMPRQAMPESDSRISLTAKMMEAFRLGAV